MLELGGNDHRGERFVGWPMLERCSEPLRVVERLVRHLEQIPIQLHALLGGARIGNRQRPSLRPPAVIGGAHVGDLAGPLHPAAQYSHAIPQQ